MSKDDPNMPRAIDARSQGVLLFVEIQGMVSKKSIDPAVQRERYPETKSLTKRISRIGRN